MEIAEEPHPSVLGRVVAPHGVAPESADYTVVGKILRTRGDDGVAEPRNKEMGL